VLEADRNILMAGALLIIAFIFGGGGSGAGLANLIVQGAAIVIIALHRDLCWEFFSRAPRHVAILIGVTLLLPLLQCIPLPPWLWHQLPGRELVVEPLVLIAKQNRWMPLSMNAGRTMIAFFALLPPLAIVILACRSTPRGQRTIIAVLVACGVIEVLLGAQQLALSNQHLMFYDEAVGTGELQGVFANRNTAGLFLAIALCALIGLSIYRPVSVPSVCVGLGTAALLLVGLILTRSRSSIALTLIPFMLFLYYSWVSVAHLSAGRARLIVPALSIGLLLCAPLLFERNDRLQSSLARFQSLEDARPAIWEDAGSSAKRFWPVGSGIGTFDDVFQIDETLESLSPGRAARAHNDYLEVLIESGLLGGVVVLCWAVAIGAALWRSLRSRERRGAALTACGVFTLLACQSVLDYPLRCQTLLCVAGLMVAILWPLPPGSARRDVDA